MTEPDARDRAMEQGRAYGNARNADTGAAARHAPTTDKVPAYGGSAPPQVELYQRGAAIEDTARTRLPASEAGSFVRDSSLARPRFTLDADTDPMLQRARTVQQRASELSGIGAEGYGDCTTTTHPGPTRTEEHLCTRWGGRVQSCERRYVERCLQRELCGSAGVGGIDLNSIAGDMRWRYRYPQLTLGTVRDNHWRAGCGTFDRRTTFTIRELDDIAAFRLEAAGWDDYIRVVLNGTQVYIGPNRAGTRLSVRRSSRRVCSRFGCRTVHSHRVDDGTGRHACELNTNWHRSGLNVDLRPYLRQGSNTLDMRVIVAGAGEGWIRLHATQYCGCARRQAEWDQGCAALQAEVAAGRCAATEVACLQQDTSATAVTTSPGPSCRHERHQYLCLSDRESIEEDYCRQLRERGCTQSGSRCVDHNAAGNCIEHEQRYRCEQATAPTTRLDCGERVYCLDGACFDSGYEASGDFGLAASHLGAMEQAAEDFDRDALTIFSGEARRCKKTLLGFANCCRDSGWGVDLGLLQCSESERILADKRSAGLCHYVGSYKRGSLLARRRYQSYCCFNSKLGRIVQQQGRVQLGIGWGSARGPACNGLSPQELARIDFEQVDFTEFYRDALNHANAAARPDGGALRSVIERKIEAWSRRGPPADATHVPAP